MSKISRLILSSLAITSVEAQDFEVTSCDDPNLPDKPAVSVKIAEQYFNDNFQSQSSSFNLANGFFEKTFEQNILDKEFDDITDGKLAMKIIYTVKCQSAPACSVAM